MSNTIHGGLKTFEPIFRLNAEGFNYKAFERMVYPPFIDTDVVTKLRSIWDTDENDVFICSHQKVGTHLTKKFVVEILRSAFNYPTDNGLFSGDIGHNTAPWPEVMASQHGIEHLLEFIRKTSGYPRVWYTHSPIKCLPFRSIHPKTKFIMTYRDPKGVAVSQYFFYKSHPLLSVSTDLTINRFIELFIEGNLYFGDYHQHVMDWISPENSRFNPSNFLALRFENLVEDKLNSVKVLSNFLLDKNVFTNDTMESIAKSTEFETMKKGIEANPGSFHFNPKTFFRSGETKDWVQHLSNENINEIDRKTNDFWGKDKLMF